MATDVITKGSSIVTKTKKGLKSLIRRTIYPYLKHPYHRYHIWKMKRYFLRKGEEAVVRSHFLRSFGYEPNLNNPRTFNEKLAWIKLHTRDPLMVKCADKYAVREYVREIIGEKYLIPLLGVYKHPDEIPFNDLPAPYVLKVNHASGGNIFFIEKDSFNKRKAIRSLNHHLKINAYYYGCEWSYKDVPPCIICERVILDENNNLPKDYKFLCFNGKPLLIQVDIDRFGDHRENYYDQHWNLLPVITDLPNADEDIPMPERFEEMLEISRKLSRPFDFVRVDLYAIHDSIYVGEMTFYPAGGSIPFFPHKYEIEYGEKIHLTGLSGAAVNYR